MQIVWPRALRSIARWAGVVIGIGVGLVYLSFSLHIFFGEPGPSTWLGFAMVVARFSTQCLLLPFSILAAFRPRIAAYGIVVSFSVSVMLTVAHISANPGPLYASGVVSSCLYWIVVPAVIAGLLFYASGKSNSSIPDIHQNHGAVQKPLGS